MKYLLYILLFSVVYVNSDDDISEKGIVTDTFETVNSYIENALLAIGKLVPMINKYLSPEVCDGGKELTMCPDPNCPIRTCENTFTGTPDCFSINILFTNPGCTWLTCRCPPNKVFKDLKCVDINECVSCEHNETQVCPDYKCAPRTCVNRGDPDVCKWDISYLPLCHKKLECACANGYVYDTNVKKCVYPEDCTRYWWNDTYGADAVSYLKDVAVAAGNDNYGEPIWIHHAGYGHRNLPGKLYTKNHTGFLPYDELEQFVCHMHVLCALPEVMEWLPFKTGDTVPVNAILGGDDETNRPQFIGRATYDGELTPGRIQEGVLYLSYAGKEYTFNEFEILCEKEDLYRMKSARIGNDTKPLK